MIPLDQYRWRTLVTIYTWQPRALSLYRIEVHVNEIDLYHCHHCSHVNLACWSPQTLNLAQINTCCYEFLKYKCDLQDKLLAHLSQLLKWAEINSMLTRWSTSRRTYQHTKVLASVSRTWCRPKWHTKTVPIYSTLWIMSVNFMGLQIMCSNVKKKNWYKHRVLYEYSLVCREACDYSTFHNESLDTFGMHLYISSNVVVNLSTSKINNLHLLPILRLFRCYDRVQSHKVMLWCLQGKRLFQWEGLK